jgi:hypothetical protein
MLTGALALAFALLMKIAVLDICEPSECSLQSEQMQSKVDYSQNAVAVRTVAMQSKANYSQNISSQNMSSQS